MVKHYKTSINLAFDFSDPNVLNNYIPSVTHENAINSFLEGITKKSSARAHIIYGPYGTGKSYLTNVFINMISPKSIFETSKAYKKIDLDSDFTKLNDSYKLFKLTRKTFIPIFFNGYEGDLNSLIYEKLSPIIKELNITIENDFYGVYLEVTSNWKAKFPSTYKNFIDELKRANFQLSDFEASVERNQKKAIQFFTDTYSKLTSGAKLRSYSSKNSLQVLEKVLAYLNKFNKGIVIVYDEFGRFLQNTNENNLVSILQDLQDIAELANNGSDNFSFILIAHKPINSYFLRFPSDYKPEFERIEKRFKQHPITTNDKITYKLARYIIEDSDHQPTKLKPNQVEKILDSINKSNFFKEFSQKEIIQDLIKGINPFNAFTIAYLNYLSSVYGQNERSMMSFLNHAANGNFSEKGISIYAVNDYFFPSADLIPEDSSYLKILKKKIHNNPLFLKNRELLKLFTLISFWYALGLNKIQEINAASFSYFLGYSEVYIDQQLEQLENNHLIRKNLSTKSYEPFESSGINIERIVNDNIVNSTIDNLKVNKVLIDILGYGFLRASFFNYKFKTTRFAIVNFILGLNVVNNIDKPNDFIINIFLIDQTTSKSEISKLIESYSSEKYMSILIHKCNISTLKERLDKLISAYYVKHNRSEFINHSNFIEDLEYYISELKILIKQMIGPIVTTSFDDQYFYLGKSFKIQNKYQLITNLSEIMNQLYPNTIVINNDQINKFNLTSVQKNAIENLGNKLIKFEHVMDGTNGPDVLAYLTIFKENNYDPFEFETERFGNYDELHQKVYKLLSKEVKVIELSKILIDKEFGYSMRKPLIPIVLLGILRPIWDNLMFFGNKTFIKDISYSFFQEMLFDENANYTVSRIIYNQNQLQAMNEIINKLSNYEKNKYLPKHIRAFKASTNWLRDLGQFVQQTHAFSKNTSIFRDLVLQSEFIPLEAFDRIGKGFSNIDDPIEEINSFLKNKSVNILNSIYSIFKVNTFEKLKIKTQDFKKEVHVGNKLAATIIKSKTDLELINDLSKSILEIDFKDLSDSIYALLISQIEILSKLALTGEFNQDELNVVSLNNQIIALPKVSSSITGSNLKDRILGMVNASKLRVAKEEIVQILFDILKEKVGEK